MHQKLLSRYEGLGAGASEIAAQLTTSGEEME
jgi:hypothetical protein